MSYQNQGWGNQQNQQWGGAPQQNQGWGNQQVQKQLPQTFGFDDEIEEKEFELLQPGKYPFVVTKIERSEYAGGVSKTGNQMPPCKCVDITVQINGLEVSDKMFLTSSNANKIFSFFLSIGDQRLPNGKIKMNWQGALGRSGWLELNHRANKNDPDKKYHNVKKWLKPEEVQASQQQGDVTYPWEQK